MIRAILSFIAVWALIFFGFSFFWHISREEKLEIVKLVGYSAATSIVAFIVVIAIVILF